MKKTLDPFYDFTIAKVFYLIPVQPQLSIIEKILQEIAKLIPILSFLVKKVEDKTKTMDEPTNEEKPPETPKKPQEWTKYSWLTPMEARHSVRVICDEMRLSWNEKQLICAVIQVESGFDIGAIYKNLNGTSDWGICQFNDNPKYGWIGKNGLILSTQEALTNPEKCVKIMIDQYKKGNLKYWTGYKNGSYKKYL